MKEDLAQSTLGRLLAATSASEVETILDSLRLSSSDWSPYGGREKNWDAAANQQSSAVGAFTELVTNSIDAILCRKAYESGLTDLVGDQAPKSMQEAVSQFYEVREGSLSSLEPRQLSELAMKSILVGIRRKRAKSKFPTITIVDFGEGQLPEMFPDTFLSLSETNKEGIGFVQGKFNMGSTGSIRFCTESDITRGHYKLIVSKRFDSDTWGWAILRVAGVRPGRSLPMVEYLKPEGRIPSFKDEKVQAFGHEDVGVIDQGSIVRLYDYDIGDGAHTVDFGLRDALMLNLFDCALPIRIFDFDAKETDGKGPLRSKGISESTFGGMGVRLNADILDPANQDPDIPEERPEKRTTEFVHLVSQDSSNPELGEVKISAIGVSKLPSFFGSSRKRVFYTVNGQTHATENAGFFGMKDVRLGDLQNNLIVVVACEKMDKTALSIFMGNREKMADNKLSRELRDLVRKRLANDAKLKEYQGIIRRRRAAQIVGEDQETASLLNDLVTRDPAIRELLGLGNVATGLKTKPGGHETWEGGREYPTILNPLNARREGDYFVKEIPLNSYRQIRFGTDAANDYLSRSNSAGWVYNGGCVIPKTVSLRNGTAIFSVFPIAGAREGDVIIADLGFDDDGPNVEPLSVSFKLVITKPEKTVRNEPGRRKEGVRKSGDKTIADPTRWVEKNDWDDFGFDANSGAAVTYGQDDLTVHVNRAYKGLVEMRLREGDESVIKLNENRFKMWLGLLTLSVYRYYEKLSCSDEDPDARSRQTSAAIAAYVLPLIRTLGGAERL